MKERKVVKTFSFDEDVIEHSKGNVLISSFSEWCSERYREEFMNVESLSYKFESLNKQLDFVRSSLKKLKEEEKDSLGVLFSDVELSWIRDVGVDRISRTTFEGVYKFFVSKFNRVDVGRRQFRVVVDRFKKER